MKNLIIMDHPLVHCKMSLLRDKNTGNKDFRELLTEISTMICYEATKDAPIEETMVETPVQTTKGSKLTKSYGIIPILRAGNGMVDGVLSLLPTAKVGHIGVFRDPDTLLPKEYFCKLPTDVEKREIFLLDPMIATGGTAKYAIDVLKNKGVERIKLLCVVTCPKGVEYIHTAHPDVSIITAGYDVDGEDGGLNDHGYIVPGLGDAGDRIYGTQ